MGQRIHIFGKIHALKQFSAFHRIMFYFSSKMQKFCSHPIPIIEAISCNITQKVVNFSHNSQPIGKIVIHGFHVKSTNGKE